MTARLIRPARMLTLLAVAGLLTGCVYDPYTGTYYPCCDNPYPYGGYPPNAPSPYPYGYPPPYYPPPDAATQPYGYAPQALAGPPAKETLAQRFAQANVTHDGRLTLQQAQAADWQTVARNFAEIDLDQKGYLTLNEVRGWFAAHEPPPSGMPG